MLGDLEQGVDQSDAKLSGAMRRMKKFIRQTEGSSPRLGSIMLSLNICIPAETKSGWCITILIVILMALLLAVILV